jgi:hypothetical protein
MELLIWNTLMLPKYNSYGIDLRHANKKAKNYAYTLCSNCFSQAQQGSDEAKEFYRRVYQEKFLAMTQASKGAGDE